MIKGIFKISLFIAVSIMNIYSQVVPVELSSRPVAKYDLNGLGVKYDFNATKPQIIELICEVFPNRPHKVTVIDYYDYKITVSSNPSEFFTGHLEAVRNGKAEFIMDSNFSDYIGHDIIDLDGDGSKDLVLFVSEGASPYIYNAMYLFDIQKGIKPLYVVQNASLDTSVKGSPKIAAYTRMSPSLLGLNYNWLMEYKKGKLGFFKAVDEPWKNSVQPDVQSLLDNLTQYEDFSEKCSDGVYNTFFETLFIQYKIAGDTKSAKSFFDRNYKCAGKRMALEQIQNAAEDTYSWLNDETNFKYGE